MRCRIFQALLLFIAGGVTFYVSFKSDNDETVIGEGASARIYIFKSFDASSSDACRIAHAMNDEELEIRSYPPLTSVFLSFQQKPLHLPHLSSILCRADSRAITPTSHRNKTPLKNIFAFKAARTGSTFFTTVITKTVKSMGRPAIMKYEPYCSWRCDGPKKRVSKMEQSLHAIMTQNCKKGARCFPGNKCHSVEAANETTFISAANPRFFHPDLNWKRILDPHARVFTLRRTNLVLMGYSKFHHGKCPMPGLERSDTFDLATLLRCTEQYALWEQEYSSSFAVRATSMVNHHSLPFMVVYEDVLADGSLVQKGLVEYLGMNITTGNMFEDNAKTSKKHNAPFCDYEDVDCKSLIAGLGGGDYPCLFKQMTMAAENHVWTVPLLPDGKISIHGDCQPLEPLHKGKFTRHIHELYQLAPSSSE